MKKNLKTIICLLTLLFVTAVLSAEGIGSVNHMEPLNDDQEYAQFLKHVFDGQPLDQAITLLEEFENSLPSKDYPEWLKTAADARANLILAKYVTEVHPKEKEKAEPYMYRAEELVAASRDAGAPYSVHTVLEALTNSFWYLVDGSMSKGMKFTSMVDDLYESHPEDFHVLLMKADRYMHSPGIAGGSKKKGRELFLEAEKLIEANPEAYAIWDKFTVYSGLAVGYTTKKKTMGTALAYANKAMEIYTNDANVLGVIEKAND